MDDQEASLTDEEQDRFDEIWQRFIKAPDDPTIVTFSCKGQEVTEWLRDKFRAVYDLLVFTGEVHYGKDFGGEATIKNVDREIFAVFITRFASSYFLKRMNDSANAFLKGVVTEIHESWPAFIEAAFGDNRAESVKANLPTKGELMEIWQGIIRDHFDPKFVR